MEKVTVHTYHKEGDEKREYAWLPVTVIRWDCTVTYWLEWVTYVYDDKNGWVAQ